MATPTILSFVTGTGAAIRTTPARTLRAGSTSSGSPAGRYLQYRATLTSSATDSPRLDEVGFSDLTAGGWIPATARVAAFDLYGKTIAR